MCICRDVDAVERLKHLLVNVHCVREGGARRVASVAAVQIQLSLKKNNALSSQADGKVLKSCCKSLSNEEWVSPPCPSHATHILHSHLCSLVTTPLRVTHTVLHQERMYVCTT